MKRSTNTKILGLALIAGNLLLQTHEEDSFWTFVALMDRHLRGYFSPTAKLIEVDSVLFARAVVNFDKPLATRLFVSGGVCYTPVSKLNASYRTTSALAPPNSVHTGTDHLGYAASPDK